MKKLILTLFAVIVAFTAFTAFKSIENAKVIAIVNKAAWCSICKAHAGRTVQTFTENNKDGFFKFLVNDITNDQSKKASIPEIAEAGLENVLDGSLGAGVLSFYDAKTKKMLAQVTVANTSKELIATMQTAREKATK